ncbi:unnamed protein product [Cylicostephanus goldi]|uniref:Uncharacterized protein n=1 Tax=Cylicostephanus goldi TaxID=71465 RepID=A0A3P6RG01_CYLGO|nr:unnamed protein product [Cylicostephanus goldi]
MLDKIQSAFGMGLSETDDFIRDIVSNGVGLVYELATAEHRKALVNDLMYKISEGKPFAAVKLAQIPQQLSTHKELCSLATELNQPDLVYKFMILARHNSVWNKKRVRHLDLPLCSKKLAANLIHTSVSLCQRFLGTDMIQISESGNLYVRYGLFSHHPGEELLSCFQVDEFADEIVKELQKQLTTAEWRVRESSCLALSDLFQSNDTPYIQSNVAELVLTVFRLRDDIKLREVFFLKTLAKLVVRLSSETSKGHDLHAFLDTFLPVLIWNGIHSDTKINKQFSISLLLELAKKAGTQLRPYLSELNPSFIDAISDTEPAILNYVAARSSLAELELVSNS